jgi:hypothetical protein
MTMQNGPDSAEASQNLAISLRSSTDLFLALCIGQLKPPAEPRPTRSCSSMGPLMAVDSTPPGQLENSKKKKNRSVTFCPSGLSHLLINHTQALKIYFITPTLIYKSSISLSLSQACFLCKN